MERSSIGSRLDALGIKSSIADDDLIAGAIVVMKVVNDDGSYLSVAWPDGVDWITRRGMLETACDVERDRRGQLDEDEL